jgi:hypothetical protein
VRDPAGLLESPHIVQRREEHVDPEESRCFAEHARQIGPAEELESPKVRDQQLVRALEEPPEFGIAVA